MSITVGEIDRLPATDAADLLRPCCGSTAWIATMVSRRPFESSQALRDTADAIWHSLDPDDWVEAFARHPRIGERLSHHRNDERSAAWSASEQSGVSEADASTLAELAAINEEYERRFGYLYIVCAAGRSADEMIALARRRLMNDPEHELHVAAEEHRKIMQIRLGKLLGHADEERR